MCPLEKALPPFLSKLALNPRPHLENRVFFLSKYIVNLIAFHA
jgi:hypothetical protein